MTEDLSTASDAALVVSISRYHQEALAEAYRRHGGAVFGLAKRLLGDAAIAEELVQEVFLRAYRGLEKFRGDAQLSTWMYRLSVNAALSHATRTQARQKRDLGEEALMALPAEDAPATDPRLRARLERALADLPAGYRAVLVLHDVEGLQHEEIADILGCRVGTSKSQLHKARAKMRELLGGAP